MKRRKFIFGSATAALFPFSVGAQRAESARRVDILFAEAIRDDPYYEGRITAIRDGLRKLGWIEGQNLRLNVHRTSPRIAEIRKHVDELLAGKPDVVVTSGSTTTGPLLQANNTVPVVFTGAVDPMGAGLVESLSQPGGNATGFMMFDYSLSGKWLEILKQVAPGVTRAGIIRDSTITSGIGQFAVIQTVAPSMGIDVVPIGARDGNEIERGIGKVARFQNGGLVTTISAAVSGYRETIINLAAQHRLPAVYGNRIWVDQGGLISYGPDQLASARLAVGYIDRILKGEKPADLPVQAPTKYELIVNLKTARTLGLTVSPVLLAGADAVIE